VGSLPSITKDRVAHPSRSLRRVGYADLTLNLPQKQLGVSQRTYSKSATGLSGRPVVSHPSQKREGWGTRSFGSREKESLMQPRSRRSWGANWYQYATESAFSSTQSLALGKRRAPYAATISEQLGAPVAGW
jgi:hypothetical protein